MGWMGLNTWYIDMTVTNRHVEFAPVGSQMFNGNLTPLPRDCCSLRWSSLLNPQRSGIFQWPLKISNIVMQRDLNRIESGFIHHIIPESYWVEMTWSHFNDPSLQLDGLVGSWLELDQADGGAEAQPASFLHPLHVFHGVPQARSNRQDSTGSKYWPYWPSNQRSTWSM